MVVVTAATVIDEVALNQLGENLGRTDWSYQNGSALAKAQQF
jgi:hypothetical protein